MRGSKELAVTFRQVLAEHKNGALGGVDLAVALAEAAAPYEPAGAFFMTTPCCRCAAREASISGQPTDQPLHRKYTNGPACRITSGEATPTVS